MTTRDLFDTVPARAVGRRAPPRTGPPTRAEVERARALAAQAVVLYGEWALPIFERLDRECAELARRDSVIDRVRAIAEGRAA